MILLETSVFIRTIRIIRNMSKKKTKKKNLPKGLPEKFVERLKEIVGSANFSVIETTFVDRPTTFRVNTLKATKAEIKEYLDERGFKTRSVPWYSDAFILEGNKTKRDLTEQSIYAEGKIYIQSLASMVPPLVLDPKPGEKILDLTAAPGSKTSQMAALMGQNGELVANELNKVRFFRLKANMEILGVDKGKDDWQFILRMEDGSVLSEEYPGYFDKILLDAPCSGESRFIDGYPKSYGFWSEHKIKETAYRQQKLLLASWHALKPGGILVYSTCTIAPEENESRISKLLERVGDEAEIQSIELPLLKILPPVMSWREREYHKDIKKTLRIFPTKDIEGFYVAKIKKRG